MKKTGNVATLAMQSEVGQRKSGKTELGSIISEKTIELKQEVQDNSRVWREGEMSASLLRKGLELLETAGVSDSSQRSVSAARPNNLLKKKKNKSSRSKRDKATIKGRIIKSALEEYQKHQAADHFKKNMQYMMGTHCVADSTTTEKILTQNRGRKAKDRPVEKVKKKPEGTVFTEEDFQRFEREYFGRAGTI